MAYSHQALLWLLETETPGVRYLSLKYLQQIPDSSQELQAARLAALSKGPIATILKYMDPKGFWVKPGPGYSQRYKGSVWTLILLSQLGAKVTDDPRIQRACEYYLDQAFCEGGYISYNGEPDGTFDCLQGNMCGALTQLGVSDPRLDQAFEWMARSVTGEGVAAATDKKARFHYSNYKCGPIFACKANGGNPCAWGAVKVMLAFSSLPDTKRTPIINQAVKQGVDFLFSVDPLTAKYPTRHGAKPSPSWWQFGFPVYYLTDLLQNVECLVSLGYKADQRLKPALDYIEQKQDKQGKWLLEHEYAHNIWGNYGKLNEPNKWFTYRPLKVLSRK